MGLWYDLQQGTRHALAFASLTVQDGDILGNVRNSCVLCATLRAGFYPHDAMPARVIAIATCPSVRLSVRHAPVLCQNEES